MPRPPGKDPHPRSLRRGGGMGRGPSRSRLRGARHRLGPRRLRHRRGGRPRAPSRRRRGAGPRGVLGDLGAVASPPCQAYSSAGKGLGKLDKPRVLACARELSEGRDTRARHLARLRGRPFAPHRRAAALGLGSAAAVGGAGAGSGCRRAVDGVRRPPGPRTDTDALSGFSRPSASACPRSASAPSSSPPSMAPSSCRRRPTALSTPAATSRARTSYTSRAGGAWPRRSAGETSRRVCGATTPAPARCPAAYAAPSTLLPTRSSAAPATGASSPNRRGIRVAPAAPRGRDRSACRRRALGTKSATVASSRRRAERRPGPGADRRRPCSATPA